MGKTKTRKRTLTKETAAASSAVPLVKRGRGRPRKNVVHRDGGVQHLEENICSTLSTIPSHLQPVRKVSSSSAWAWVGELFNNEVDKDLTILIGKEAGSTTRLETHKAFLQIRSRELKKLAEDAKDGVIHLRTVDAKAFEHLFWFLYRNQFEDRNDFIDEDCVNVLKLGNRYCPQDEAKICCELMMGRITLKNVFSLRQKSICYRLTELKAMTDDYIFNNVNKNTEKFIQTEDFLNMEVSCLAELLKSDELQAPEIALFKAVVKWGQNQMIAGNALENLINFIRFPLMQVDEIEEFVGPAGVLTTEEMQDLRDYVDDKPNSCKFATRPRAYATYVEPNEFEAEGGIEPGRNADISIDEIVVKVECSTPTHTPDTPPLSPCREFSPLFTSPRPSGRNTCGPTEQEELPSLPVEKLYTSCVYMGPEPGVARVTVVADNILEFDEILQQELKSKTENVVLSSIKRVEITGVLKDSKATPHKPSRLILPNLEAVFLNLTIPVQLVDGKSNKIILLRQNFNLNRYTFFKKSVGGSLFNLDQPVISYGFDVDSHIVLNGVKFFTFCRSKQELTIGFDGLCSYPLLQRFDEISKGGKVRTVILSDCVLPTTPTQWSSFEEVMLWGVHAPSTTQLGQFLRSLPNLENLTCWILAPRRKEDGIRDQSCVNLEKDLPSRKKLRKIAIYWSKLILHRSVKIETIIMDNLVELYTDCCNWSPVIFENFHFLFPNLERLAIGVCKFPFSHDELLSDDDSDDDENSGRWGKRQKLSGNISTQLVSSVSVRAMLNFLKVKPIKWIRIAKMDWTDDYDSDKHKQDLLEFLQKAEVNSSKFSEHPVDDFVLEKNVDKGSWKGKALFGRDADGESDLHQKYYGEMHKYEYDNFKLDRIFQSFEAFEIYNVEM